VLTQTKQLLKEKESELSEREKVLKRVMEQCDGKENELKVWNVDVVEST